MVIDYYAKYPDHDLKIVKKDGEEDNGGRKQPADVQADESSDDEDTRQKGQMGNYMFNPNGYDVTCMQIIYMEIVLMLLILLSNTA